MGTHVQNDDYKMEWKVFPEEKGKIISYFIYIYKKKNI